jgi:hypothetical protein
MSVICFSIVSCGGGGGAEPNNSNTNPSSNGNINNSLTGRLFVNSKKEGAMVDLTTGKVSRFPDIPWEQTSDYRDGTKYSAMLNSDGSEFLLTALDCEYHSENSILERYRDCLATVDANGKTINRIAIYQQIHGNAKYSIDGNYIAFMHTDNRNNYEPAELYISDKYLQQNISHSVIEHSKDYNSGLIWRGFDWAQNGQIVYAYDKSIFVTAPYSTEGTPIYTAQSSSNGDDLFVSTPKVSPDGTKIAFRLMTSANQLIEQGNVWVMNFDGTDPHRLVHTPDYTTDDGGTASAYQVYNDLAWSPNGKYILVQVGGTSGDLVSGPAGASDAIYAVASSSRDVPLNNNGNHSITKIRTYYDSPNKLTYRFEPNSGTITWLK